VDRPLRGRFQKEGGDVTVQVVDRREGEPKRPRERLRRREPDEERADQPRPSLDSDALDVRQLGERLAERLADHRCHELEVSARRDLGHDAPVRCMQLRLGRHHVCQDRALRVDDRGGGLVAGGLEGEDHPSRHMIRASSRLSV
jgi:hypothetical protein